MRSAIILSFVILILAGCSSTKQLGNLKTSAENFSEKGDYLQAVEAWNQYFQQTPLEETPGIDYAQAAKIAVKAGQTEQAIAWFDQARYKNYADVEMYRDLAEIYREQDNLSKELSALEFYSKNYGTGNSEVNARLFELYSEIDEYSKAKQAWNGMNPGDKTAETNLIRYLEVNKEMENEAVCDSVATVLLQLNPDQFEALDWMAKKYYWAGQNRYDQAMKEYEQNKTRKQYNILLKELDKVTADFKKALPYLEKLWEQKPGKEYAGYFANIYARFGDEQKAEYYKRYMDN